jgi:hypothetical protein
MFKNFSDKIKEQSEKVKELKEKLPGIDLSKFGVEKLNETIKQVMDILPEIEKAGYTLSETEIELGIPPTVKIHFQIGNQTEDLEKVIPNLPEDNKLGNLILKGLLLATKVQNMVNIKGEKLQEVEIELGATPKVTIHFQKA